MKRFINTKYKFTTKRCSEQEKERTEKYNRLF